MRSESNISLFVLRFPIRRFHILTKNVNTADQRETIKEEEAIPEMLSTLS
jgi:hypothetical protein